MPSLYSSIPLAAGQPSWLVVLILQNGQCHRLCATSFQSPLPVGFAAAAPDWGRCLHCVVHYDHRAWELPGVPSLSLGRPLPSFLAAQLAFFPLLTIPPAPSPSLWNPQAPLPNACLPHFSGFRPGRDPSFPVLSIYQRAS